MMKYILLILVLLSCGEKSPKVTIEKTNNTDTILADAGGGLFQLEGDSVVWVEPTFIVDDSSDNIYFGHGAPQKHRIGLLNFKFPKRDTVFIHSLDTDKYPDGSMLFVADGKLYPLVFRPMEFTYRKPKRKKPVMLLPHHNYDIHLRVDTNLYKRWSDSVMRFMDTSIIIKDTHILP